MLLSCNIFGYLTPKTFHGEKKLQKLKCILMKEQFCLNDFVSKYKYQTEKQYDHSKKQYDTISFSSSPTSNEVVEEDEESNIINFTTTDASSQNNANISTTCHSNKNGEVNLQSEDFYYLSYQHNRMNGNHTSIFSS